MPVHNADIAAVFGEIADRLAIRGDNPFRIRAYRNAARSVGAYGRQLGTLIEGGAELPKLPGIGADLDAKIHEIIATGRCAVLDRLRREMPQAITQLLKVPGLGPKRVQALNRELGIASVEQLKQAAEAGHVRTLAGFGAKTQQRIIDALASPAGTGGRVRLATAAEYADALVSYLRRTRGVKEVVVAGSYRRRQETVGDLDILVTARGSATVMRRFVEYDEVRTVLAHGATKTSVVLRSGLQVDLRLVPTQSYGAALHYFTGSKSHNIAVRKLAQARGLKLNEYGVYRGSRRIAGATEKSVFAAVGLPFIAPELREDRGEIEAARAGRLPRLVVSGDLRGDLHTHTSASDGHNTIREMALAARKSGLDYIAITDHSRHLTIAHGLDPQRIARQLAEIDALQSELKGITLLKGAEVDILEDGTLDLPDSILQQLDIVIAAVHGQFELPRRRQTERILRALDNQHVRLLAHPGGRLIGTRKPIEVDMLRLMRKASARNVALELNAQPARLDLDDVMCRMARDEGVLVSINSDAHSSADFTNLRYGIGQARRGWLTAADVVNTRPLNELKALFTTKRAQRRS